MAGENFISSLSIKRFEYAGRASVRRQLQELLGGEGSLGKARLAYGPFEVIYLVNPNANGGMARPLRFKMDHGPPLHFSVYVAPEFLSIVDHRNVVPDIQRVKLVAKQESFVGGGRVQKRIQAPLIANHADLKQHPRVRVLAGLGILFSQMKPALFRSPAALRAKYRLKRKDAGSGEGMFRDKERVIDPVELDRLSQRSLDHMRMAKNGNGLAADFIEALELPYLGTGRLSKTSLGQNQPQY